MKKILFIIASVALVLSASAQQKSNRLGFGIGILAKRGLEGTIIFEHESSYSNLWELFLNGYMQWNECPNCGCICKESFLRSYNNILCGVAYKPCVARMKNSHGNIRIATSCGSDMERVIAGLQLGYEHNWALRNGWKIYCQAKIDYVLPQSNKSLRGCLAFGVKFPSLERKKL